MDDSAEVSKLKARIAELEHQMQEERDEFQWDLKAAKESTAGTVHKLEEEIERLKSQAAAGSKPDKGKPDDVKMLTKRALMAERRVAELQEELKRPDRLTSPPPLKDDSLMRQRAEAAEKERDQLRKEKRALERTLAEKNEAAEKLKKDLEDSKGLKQQMESLKLEVTTRGKELKQAKGSTAGQAQLEEETSKLRAELSKKERQLTKYSSDLKEKERRVSELAQELNNLAGIEAERDRLNAELQEARRQLELQPAAGEKTDAAHGAKAGKQKVAELEREISRLKHEMAQMKIASGQMVEQRERETGRLRADLQEVAKRDVLSSEQTEGFKREIARLRDELAVTTRERGDLVAQLRALREDDTVVYRPARLPAAQLDEFGGAAQQTDVPQGAREAASVAAPAQARVAGESAMGFATPEAEREVLAKVAVKQKGVPPLPKGRAAAKEAPSKEEGALPGTEDEKVGELGDFGPPPAASVEREAPPLMDFNKEEEWLAKGEEAPLPMADSIRVRTPSKGGLVFKLMFFLAVVGGIGYGAYRFFPEWFGLGAGSGGEQPVAAPVADAGTTAITTAEPDAGSVGTASGSDAGVGPGAASGAEPDRAALADGGRGSDKEVAVASVGKPPATVVEKGEELPPEQAAGVGDRLVRAREHGLRLLNQKRYKKAQNFLRDWVKVSPRDVVLRYLYGQALFQMNQFKAAGDQYEKAIDLDPKMADAYYELASVYLKLRQKDQACESLKFFTRLAPSHPQQRYAREQIKKLNCP